MGERDTKTRLLDAAEELVATRGFASTSLRAVTAAAGVNLAAANYHFGSKEALVAAVFQRRIEPVNRERLERLTALEAEHGDSPVPLPDILEAFLAPALDFLAGARGAETLLRLHARLHAEPGGRWFGIFVELFREVAERYTAAFRKTLPDLPQEELVWRFQFMIGVLVYTMSELQQIEHVIGKRSKTRDPGEITRRLVVFLEAGFRAPVPTAREGTKP
jgi:AcrR family transcriptional regulator